MSNLYNFSEAIIVFLVFFSLDDLSVTLACESSRTTRCDAIIDYLIASDFFYQETLFVEDISGTFEGHVLFYLYGRDYVFS